MLRKATAGCLLICLHLGISYGQIRPDPLQTEAWENFKVQYGQDWQIRWNPDTGTPASIYMGLSKAYKGSPVEIAQSFLTENDQIFKTRAGLPGFQHIRTLPHNGLNHVKLQQVYAGIHQVGENGFA